MKLTKGMKKALSLLLSAAMVVTGVNVTTNTASAAESDSTNGFNVKIVATTSKTTTWATDETAGKVTGVDTKSVQVSSDWDKVTSKVLLADTVVETIASYKKPTIKVTDLSDDALFKIYSDPYDMGNGTDLKKGEEVDLSEITAKEGFPGKIKKVEWNNETNKNEEVKDENGDVVMIPGSWGFVLSSGATADFTIYDAAAKTDDGKKDDQKPADDKKDDASNTTSGSSVTSGSTVTTAPAVSETPADPTTAPAVTTTAPAATATAAPATATPEPTEKPDEENQAFLMFTDKDWALGNWNTKVAGGVGKDATITGNGTYTVSIENEAFGADAKAANGANVFCVDIMGICNTQKFDASKIAFSDVVVKADGKEIKTDITKMYEGDIEGKGNYRLEIRNEYGYGEGEFATKDEFDEMNPDFTFEKSLSVTFTIKGIKEGKTPEGAFKTADDKSVVAVGGERAKAADAADVVKTAAPSTKPAVTTTKPAVTTKPAITTAAAVKGTSKLTAAKKLVVVAPGKSVNVAFKATKAKNTSGAAVVKATSKSKKVATVKVKGKKVVIKAPKKAVKGASTVVTLKSTKANGKAISAKIKVYVRNSAKKVKAAKKSITVKKGKTTKLVIKASKVQNKKKAFADTITVKGKVVKLTAVKYAKGKATLTLKGAKKAKKKAVTIKVGKKAVKVKATVK